MIRRTMVLTVAAIVAAHSASARAEILVSALGQNGWNSEDTRVAGVNATTAPDINSRIQFSGGPAGSDGSVNLLSPASNDKATIAYVDTNGLGGLAGLTASYRWYKDGPVGAPAPALKLGLQTTDYGSTGSSSRIGENNWDKVFIYEPYDNPDAGSTPIGTWVTQIIDPTNGTWWMFDRTIGAAVNLPHSSLTINQWLADGTYGTRLTGATIVDIQLGVGSGNAGSIGYVDWLETSALASGERVNFVPEPASLTLTLLALAATSMFVGAGASRRVVLLEFGFNVDGGHDRIDKKARGRSSLAGFILCFRVQGVTVKDVLNELNERECSDNIFRDELVA